MKRFKVIVSAVILALAEILGFTPVVQAATNDFYFEDATFDYYLENTENGTKMHVAETLVAVFPDYDQNHGIERALPRKNQDSTNWIIETPSKLNFSVTRNGAAETFTRTSLTNDYIAFRIGNASEYVHGRQTYTLEYDYYNVVTEFDENSENITGRNGATAYQEIYWDTNGTGWAQSFNHLTANLHLPDLSAWNGTSVCYVGYYSFSTGQCNVSKTADGFSFETSNLSAHQNLTFSLDFKPNSFNAVKPTIRKYSSNTNNFYFESADFDYTLYRAADNSSRLKVKETLVAVFPEDIDQNHGIVRAIPILNQGGKNYVLDPDSYNFNVSVTRNGETEPFRVSKSGDTFQVKIGDTLEYVHGTQTYVLEYEFKNVVVEFSEDGGFQELYWDTNGTGWNQKFNNLTATLHLPSDITTDKTSCYVGKFGDTNQSRCTIEKNTDGFKFSTSNLAIGENLTFATRFPLNSFYVPPIRKYYFLLFAFLITLLICALVLLVKFHDWKTQARAKYLHKKSLFTAPQYSPNLTVAEAAQLSFKTLKSPRVATLIELAVKKHISIKQNGKEWSIIINNLDGLSASELNVLWILANSSKIQVGDEIAIKKHTATSKLRAYSEAYDDNAATDLRRKKFFEVSASVKDTTGKTTKNSSSQRTLIASLIIVAFTFLPIIIVFAVSLGDATSNYYGSLLVGEVVGTHVFPVLVVVSVIATIVAATALRKITNRYKYYTLAGIEAENYLRGLEEYIKMAKADRIKFLQSVSGVDTTPEGIVKLYEKLLPFAVLFSVEKSWLGELQKYYDIANVTEYASSFNFGDALVFSTLASSISHTISSSTNYTPPPVFSSGGSWSSGSSGGSWSSSSSSSGSSGGGSSGGGGGGGGGGGW